MLTEAGDIQLASHAWLVEGSLGTMLIDTGVGNAKHRPMAPLFHDQDNDFLSRLATAGVPPEKVEMVLHTHLHVDHVGWNTMQTDGVWLPTFPKARYIFLGDEYRFFANPANFSPRHRNSFLARQDSVDPVVANGQAVMIESDGHDALPGVRFLATPGHSPHHAAILISSEGKTALFAGDTLHHPAQVYRPEVNSIFDTDTDAARASRAKVLEIASHGDTLLFGAHISGSSVLRITRGNDGYAWQEM
jgi:glyoxylase-like metal-dependent hydrolase (beta-lactamase superfamily II)